MKSYQVVDFGKPLELREYENPKPKGKEILIKISACGVCHSDLHLADGYFDLGDGNRICLLYTSPSPRDVEESRMPSSA